MARFFEVDKRDLGRVRDAVKTMLRRQDSVRLSAWEVWKMALVAAAGGAFAWVTTHVSFGGGK